MRDAAVHRPLDTRTQATRARARVKVRPQNSHVVKLERCAKLTDLSDLMLADPRAPTTVVREMEPGFAAEERDDALRAIGRPRGHASGCFHQVGLIRGVTQRVERAPAPLKIDTSIVMTPPAAMQVARSKCGAVRVLGRDTCMCDAHLCVCVR